MSVNPSTPRTERLIFGITGRIGSGKTSVGSYLQSKHNFQYIRYSQVLADWRANSLVPKSNLQQVGWDVMSGGLQAELNSELINKILPGTDVVVDGLRHPIDRESLKNSFGSSFYLVYIDSDADLRWERLRKRGRYDKREVFDVADAHPVEKQIELLRAKASKILKNEKTLEDLYSSIDLVLGEFRTDFREKAGSP